MCTCYHAIFEGLNWSCSRSLQCVEWTKSLMHNKCFKHTIWNSKCAIDLMDKNYNFVDKNDSPYWKKNGALLSKSQAFFCKVLTYKFLYALSLSSTYLLYFPILCFLSLFTLIYKCFLSIINPSLVSFFYHFFFYKKSSKILLHNYLK